MMRTENKRTDAMRIKRYGSSAGFRFQVLVPRRLAAVCNQCPWCLSTCSAKRSAWPPHAGNQICMGKRSSAVFQNTRPRRPHSTTHPESAKMLRSAVLQNTQQPVLAARPRPKQEAELGERISEYTRETTRAHHIQARQKSLEWVQWNPCKQHIVPPLPVLDSNLESFRWLSHKMT